MNKYISILVSMLAISVAGCASNPVPDPEADSEIADASADTGTYDGNGFDNGRSLADERSDELSTVIYFDFDQDRLKPEHIDLLTRHAGQLSGDSDVQVRLEGHADERGSREYNVGLGERRSQAVRDVLLANGVSNAQLLTVSFGEERPAVDGSNEQSYALNRRVEINYMN
jgi:peptidoglycan-associated lipoprotein